MYKNRESFFKMVPLWRQRYSSISKSLLQPCTPELAAKSSRVDGRRRWHDQILGKPLNRYYTHVKDDLKLHHRNLDVSEMYSRVLIRCVEFCFGDIYEAASHRFLPFHVRSMRAEEYDSSKWTDGKIPDAKIMARPVNIFWIFKLEMYVNIA